MEEARRYWGRGNVGRSQSSLRYETEKAEPKKRSLALKKKQTKQNKTTNSERKEKGNRSQGVEHFQFIF